MYVTGVQVPIGAVASGQEGELHSQFKPNLLLPLQLERPPIHTALHQTGPRPIMFVLRVSWAPFAAGTCLVPGPGALGPLHTTT